MKMTIKTFAGRPLLCSLLLATLALPALQGCFPIMAGGMTAGALMVSDRRTSGSYVEDEGIEWKVSDRISQQFGDRVHINVTSYNRQVLLTGEVPDAATRDAVASAAGRVENVRTVSNETTVAGSSSLTSRGNDAYLTSKVKARFVDANQFSANLVKVVTEANTVYLMGLVTKEEAKYATELARTTGGVQKVVTLFEIISFEEARKYDTRDKSKQPDANTR